jgi:hypothetical protein
MFGAVSSGITEGKGKAIVSAAGYRYCPAVAKRRRIPQAFYDRFQAKVQPAQKSEEVVRLIPPADETQMYIDMPEEKPSVTVQEQFPEIEKEPLTVVLEELPPAPTKEKCAPLAKEKRTVIPRKKRPGVRVSRELLEMAGFPEHQQIYNLMIK